MKRDDFLSRLTAAFLAYCLCFGGVGCLGSGFYLEDIAMASLGLALAVFCLCCSFLFGRRWGIGILLCLLALGAGYLWRRGTLTASFSSLLYEITLRYDRAYGIGTYGAPGGSFTTALLTLGFAVAFTVSGCVVRQKSALPALAVGAICPAACLVVTDTVPGKLYLFLLLLGTLLLILTNHLRRGYPGQANTLTAMALVPTALLLTVLFWAMPQDSYVNQAGTLREEVTDWILNFPEKFQELTEEVVSEADDSVQPKSVNLSLQGPLWQQTYPVMEVTAPKSGTLYLREQSYDTYTGFGWRANGSQREAFGEGRVDWEEVGTVKIVTRRTREVLYYPYYPASPVSLRGGRAENKAQATEYEFLQQSLPSLWERDLTDRRPREIEGWLELPDDTRRRAERLLEDILTDEQTATEKARAIAAYVRSSAKYDLNTPRMPSSEEDFALWFLEDSDTGYCVHFATATAVLLRAADVQSRYVTGYMVQGRRDEPVTVTAAEDHAWVEYYEPYLGLWLPLESTPAAENRPQQESRPLNTLPPAQETEPADTPEETTEEPERETSGANDTDARAPAWAGKVPLWPLAIILLPALTVFQRHCRLALRRRGQTRGSPNAQALALWQEALLWARATKAPAPQALEALAQKAKYSQHTLTGEELGQFEAYFTQARALLQSRPWYIRALARWVWAL